MRLSEKWKNEAAAGGCEAKLAVWDAVIDDLQRNGTRSIAVLGETSSGKTTLLNRIAGREVRRPTLISMEEQPLMLTSCRGRTKPGYEAVEMEPGRWEDADVSFFEIPINIAIDYETRELSPVLEEMDAVIYVLSAVTPFTGSDDSNFAALVGKMPVVFYLSKAELLTNDEERRFCTAYIQERITSRQKSVELIDGLRPDAAEALVTKVLELSTEDARQAHIERLERQAANTVALGLERRLAALEAVRRAQEAERAAAEQTCRGRTLVWDGLRIELMERTQRTLELADSQLAEANDGAEKRLIQSLRESGYSQDWRESRLEQELRRELEDALNNALSKAADRAGADAAWLASEVYRKFGMQAAMEELDDTPTAVLPIGEPDTEPQAPGRARFVAAAGTGLLAGGAILSSMSLLPTCLIALPASFVAMRFFQEGIEEQERYRQGLRRQVSECCNQNFRALSEALRRALEAHYSRMLDAFRELDPEPQPVLGLLDGNDARIAEMLRNIKSEYGL